MEKYNKKIRKYLGPITLVLLVMLALLKYFLGGCRIWICGTFVAVVVVYKITSDFLPDEKKEADESGKF